MHSTCVLQLFTFAVVYNTKQWLASYCADTITFGTLDSNQQISKNCAEVPILVNYGGSACQVPYSLLLLKGC